MSRLTDALKAGAAALGLSLSPQALDAFQVYYDILARQNQVMDLTAVNGEAETAQRHFLDSLALSAYVNPENRVLDVGSGAGFPGLPLKIWEPRLSLCLLDAQQKRVDFLQDLCRALELEADCLHARAEEQALLPGYRDSFDLVVSRAVARLNQLTELCLPFVRPGGRFLAMKARDCDQELAEADSAIRLLGGRVAQVKDYDLCGVPRRVVVIEKCMATPPGYPRRYAKIQKKPL